MNLWSATPVFIIFSEVLLPFFLFLRIFFYLFAKRIISRFKELVESK